MSLVENKVYSEGGFNQSIRLNSLNIFEFNMVGSITKNVDNFYCTGGWFTLKNGNSNRNMVVVKHFKCPPTCGQRFQLPSGQWLRARSLWTSRPGCGVSGLIAASTRADLSSANDIQISRLQDPACSATTM